MAERLRRQDGHALLMVLIATALLLPLGALAMLQARLDFLVTHYARAASEAFTVAEAGLDHALADFARDPRFDRLLVGPDRRAGTGDDGEYPFAQAPPASFPAAPYRYDVRVASRAADRVEIVSRGYGRIGSLRAVAAAVRRVPLLYLPAALASAAPVVDLTIGAGWRIAGGPGVPALALDSEATLERVRVGLDADERSRLSAPGGTPGLAVGAIPDVAGLVGAAARRPDTRLLGGEATGSLGEGLFLAPAGTRLRDVTGSGILLVDGALDIEGTVAFDGLVAVTRGVAVAPDATMRLSGSLLQGDGGGALALRGSGEIAYDDAIAERLATLYPGMLPSRARVTGWREFADASDG